ncbi:MAG: DUF3016 domain-containing protein [Xanthomonadaceae bacterium]|jgi:hypothetical protein|nr:DUF3016 domain-containing protein [Xanthomonadaceae bacterium]
MLIASMRTVLMVVGLSLSVPLLAGPYDVTDPQLPRQLPDSGPVQVAWTDPAEFSDIRSSGNRWEARRGDWVRQLAVYLRSRASRQLADGERLEVTITDIQRAGRYEPWLGSAVGDVRIVRTMYPPWIELDFILRDAQGTVLSEGHRRLTDLAFLHRNAGRISSSDPLRHEKRLLNDWVRREFGPMRMRTTAAGD